MSQKIVDTTLALLGHKMRDRITGLSGVVTSVCFDLYGCTHAVLNSGLDKDGKIGDQHWFDVKRLEKTETFGRRVMEPPSFADLDNGAEVGGDARKPLPSAS
jgi:hypothetical protein